MEIDIHNCITELYNTYTELQNNGKLSSFDLTFKIHNIHKDFMGEIVYDMKVDAKLEPKKSLEFIDVNFTILRTGDNQYTISVDEKK